jgi:hypothetical protein
MKCSVLSPRPPHPPTTPHTVEYSICLEDAGADYWLATSGTSTCVADNAIVTPIIDIDDWQFSCTSFLAGKGAKGTVVKTTKLHIEDAENDESGSF